jgi:uncharacterized protein (TIGR02391 family)
MSAPETLLKALVVAASSIQSAANEAGLGVTVEDAEPLSVFDRVITEPEIIAVSRESFRDGYYAYAVEQCFKELSTQVRRITGSAADGVPLMESVFSAKAPKLKLNPGVTLADKDEQRGYMELYAAAVMGIRNPRAHDTQRQDDAATALELLVLGNHLLRTAKQCTVVP